MRNVFIALLLASSMVNGENGPMPTSEAPRPQKEEAPPSAPHQASTPVRITRAVNPNDYYPPRSVRHGELGSPVVEVCVGPTGALLRDPIITGTSGFRDLDGAAVKVAKDMEYAAGTENGVALPESCVKFKVKFDLSKR